MRTDAVDGHDQSTSRSRRWLVVGCLQIGVAILLVVGGLLEHSQLVLTIAVLATLGAISSAYRYWKGASDPLQRGRR